MKVDDGISRDARSDEKSLLFRGTISVVCACAHHTLEIPEGKLHIWSLHSSILNL